MLYETKDHSLKNENEKKQINKNNLIEKNGIVLLGTEDYGTMTTRGFGDLALLDNGMISTPDIKHFSDASKIARILIASNGIFDKFKSSDFATEKTADDIIDKVAKKDEDDLKAEEDSLKIQCSIVELLADYELNQTKELNKKLLNLLEEHKDTAVPQIFKLLAPDQDIIDDTTKKLVNIIKKYNNNLKNTEGKNKEATFRHISILLQRKYSDIELRTKVPFKMTFEGKKVNKTPRELLHDNTSVILINLTKN